MDEVHNSDFPGGAVRGQLAAVTEPAIPALSGATLAGLAVTLAALGILAIRRA